jgi:uncharacterized membrane protein YhaH (DUF805 family)
MDWYLKVLKNYVGFEGRARRKEYWMFVLFNIIVAIGVAIVDLVLGTSRALAGMGALGGLYNLAILLPSIALGARRLHDIGKSGWWQLIAFIPILGWIVLIVWAATEGTHGSNDYGDDPKADEDGQPVMA